MSSNCPLQCEADCCLNRGGGQRIEGAGVVHADRRRLYSSTVERRRAQNARAYLRRKLRGASGKLKATKHEERR